jgi:L-fuculose-phosphate aldolase
MSKVKPKIEYKEMLAASAKRFYEKKCTPGMDSGDMSIRDVETGYIYIYPRPHEGFNITSWDVLKPENIAVVDMDGNYIEDEYMATVELPMHLEIYKARPEITVILHSHPLWSSVFAACGKNIPLSLAEQALFLGGEIICAEYGTVGSMAIAKNIVAALGKDKRAALMRNHGSVVLGNSFDEVFALSDFLEHGAQVILFGKLLGGVIEVAPDNILDPSIM